MTLITSPMNVRVFGEIFESASPRTIFCSSQPLPLPNARVQVMKNSVSSLVDSNGQVLRKSRILLPFLNWREATDAEFSQRNAVECDLCNGRGPGRQGPDAA